MIYLIDSDTPAFAASVVHEESSEQQAIWEGAAIIERWAALCGAQNYRLYLTGDSNFRYSIFPEYKADRLKTPRPKHYNAVKESFVRSFGAIVSNGCEADDLLGIEQMSYFRNGSEDSCIVSIDKDLNCIPGWHFNPGLTRKGIVIKEPTRYLVSPKEALHFFYTQLLVGDTADGIKGAMNIGPVKAKKILEGCETEWDYYQTCLEHFSCEEELLLNAQCLHIFQKEGDIWHPPIRSKEVGMDSSKEA